MPVLEIELVLMDGETFPPDLAASLADELGSVFASPPGGTWVRLRFLPRTQYAENSGGPPEGVNPAFVSVLKAGSPLLGERQVEARRIAEIIAELCSRPKENIHVLYLPPAEERIAFGGELKEGS